MRRTADAKAVAEAEGVAVQTVRGWVARGCPHGKRGQALRFNLEEVRAWRARNASVTGHGGARKGSGRRRRRPRAPTPADAAGAAQAAEASPAPAEELERRALGAIQRETAELKLATIKREEAERTGALVSADGVRAVWARHVLHARAALASLPRRAAAELCGAMGVGGDRVSDVRGVLERYVGEVGDTLADDPLGAGGLEE